MRGGMRYREEFEETQQSNENGIDIVLWYKSTAWVSEDLDRLET